MVTPRERFQALAGKWFISEPALFAVYCTHDLEENGRITCGIRSGQGRIEFNPNQVNLMSDPEFEQRLKAEMIRLCLRHPYERQPVNCCHQALQMGSDMVISPAYKLPLINLAKPEDMKLPVGQHFEWYADTVNDLLREQQEANSKNGEEDQKGKSSSNSSQNSEDGQSSEDGQPSDEGTQESQPGDGEGHKGDNGQGSGSGELEGQGSGSSKKADDQSTEEGGGAPSTDKQGGSKTNKPQGNGKKEKKDEGSGQGSNAGNEQGSNAPQLPQFVDNGYTGLWREDEERMEQMKGVLQGVSNWGSVPGQMVEVIQKALEGRIDYRKVLRAFQTSVISTNRSLTRMRPNRRFGFEAMGSKHDLSSRLLVAVDVSGSVSDKALGKFFRIITNFFKYGVDAIDVIQFDAAVTPKVMDLKTGSKEIKSSKFKIQGRGGTNFQCVIDYLKEHNSYDGLIFFTDGYAPAPVIDFHTRAKLLWVTETVQEYNQHKHWMKQLGRACFIK